MKQRADNLQRLRDTVFDAVIIGGGINGAVSAAALAARGAKVALIDSRDFAGFTSQQSSNLVWGGIKYMEGFEFGLVWDLCKSRNELMRSFPSTIKEVRFLTTVNEGFRRSPWLLWAGTWLYWLFGRGQTRLPSLRSKADINAVEPLINTDRCEAGIEYSDAYLYDNDARFVFNFVRDALDLGCAAANYVTCTAASREADGWHIQARDEIEDRRFEIRSQLLVNAAGAFVDDLNRTTGVHTEHQHVLSKGIHLLVPRISKAERVLAFFADDGRLFFAIPMGNRTCIGTTDTRVPGPYGGVEPEDRQFVLDNINARLRLERPLTADDVIAERCGVRPLAVKRGANDATDFLQLSRKHVIEVAENEQQISIFGGKLTDCLNVGREVCEAAEALGVALAAPREDWFGEPPEAARLEFERAARALGVDESTAGDTGEPLSTRLWRRYGSRAHEILQVIEADPASMEPVVEGMGLRWCELGYIREHEMVVTLEDLLRRRSKLALLGEQADLQGSAGLRRACRELFGAEGDDKFGEYFASR